MFKLVILVRERDGVFLCHARLLERLPQAVFTGNETLAVLHARRLSAALYFVGPEAVCSSFLVSLVRNFQPTGPYKLILYIFLCVKISHLSSDLPFCYSFSSILTCGYFNV